MPNLVADLLTEIERVSFAPENQTTFDIPNILSIADEVIEAQIQPKIILAREGYFIKKDEQAITVGQSRYELPDRAAGLGFRDIKITDANETRNLIYQDFSDLRDEIPGIPRYFYLEENSVVLYPSPSETTGTLEMYFPIKANKLVQASAAGVIDSIDTGTNTITVASMPSTWVGTNTYDIIKQSGGHELRAYDQLPTSFDLPTLTMVFSSLPDGLALGDYVAQAQETPVVQLPSLFVRALARAVAAEMIGDMNQPSAKKLLERFDKDMENAINLITPRVVGAPKYIVNENW